MADPKAPAESGWAVHEREQRRRWATLTHRERLAWLWQAKQFAARALARVRVRGGTER